MSSSSTSLFLLNLDVSTFAMGAPTLHLALTVNTVSNAVAGSSQVFQPISPPLDVVSQVAGDFTYMTVMPQKSHILLKGTGNPLMVANPTATPYVTNLEFHLVLDADWTTGEGEFKYLDPQGHWHTVKHAKVRPGSLTAPAPLETAA